MICMTPIKQIVDQYVDDVISGRITAGKLAIAACERHLSDMNRIGSDDFPYYFNEEDASDCCQFFPLALKHSKGSLFAGNPFHLEPWQLFIVWSIYGWKRIADDTRRFRYAHLSFARKNGKSTLAAGFALIGLVWDGEPGAEIYIAATKKDQAKCVFDEAVRMRTSNPKLNSNSPEKGLIKSHINRLFVPATNSFCCTTASDKPLDGPNPHYVIFDELHAWTEQHRKYYNTMVTGSASRTQPMQIEITTFGDDQSKIWLETLELCKSIALGVVKDETKFVFIAAIDDDDDPYNEECWIKANPNMGVSVSLDYMRQQATDARNKPTFLKTFLSKHLNRITTSHQKAFEPEVWLAAYQEQSDWSNADAFGAGVDLGARDDFAASAVCARFCIGEQIDDQDETKTKPVYRYELRAKGYMASDTVRDLHKEPFAGWIYYENMIVSRFPIIQLRTDLIESCAQYSIREIAHDPYNAQELAEHMKLEGIEPYRFAQNPSMFSGPVQDFISLLKNGLITHDGNPVLRWMANNAVIVKNSADRWMFDKAASADKIDMIVACVMAFRMAQRAPQRSTGPVFLI